MKLKRRLATAFLTDHPGEAATALAALPVEQAAAVLAGAPSRTAAAVLERSERHQAAAVVSELSVEQAQTILEVLRPEVGASLLRHVGGERRRGLLEGMRGKHARALRAQLGFAAGTAGALVDPLVVALLEDLTVEQATKRLRRETGNAIYNVYVVDSASRLVGVLNLRELLRGESGATLKALMHPATHKLYAEMDRLEVISDPGWREVHSMPVVDSSGIFVGAIRYRTLRRLQDELRLTETDQTPAVEALGELFWIGLAALLEALTASTGRAGSRHGPDPR